MRLVAQPRLVFLAEVAVLYLLQFVPLRHFDYVVVGAGATQRVLDRLEQRDDLEYAPAGIVVF